MRRVDLAWRLPVKRRAASQRGEEHRAEAVDVGGRSEHFVKGFGRQICDRFRRRAAEFWIDLRDVPQDAEISQQDVPSLEKVDIDGLEVFVCDAETMGVGQAGGKL